MAAVWTDRPDRAAVTALAAAAAAADGIAPLAEQTLLDLDRGRHLIWPGDGPLQGYATPAEGTGELVVAPTARRQGVGGRLLAELLTTTDRVWAHGDLPAARALAAAAGLHRQRVLWQLRRDPGAPLPAAPLPAGVTVRTFRPGVDEASWLALNKRAFADHPEQGRWSAADLAARQAERWFNPAGFFLAVRGPTLVGFHWTKVEAGPDGAVGEVYVVGVDPDAAGGGLGRALTVHGLAHLRDRGVAATTLFVDEGNGRALGMYERLGFTRARADVTYQRGGAVAGPHGAAVVEVLTAVEP